VNGGGSFGYHFPNITKIQLKWFCLLIWGGGIGGGSRKRGELTGWEGCLHYTSIERIGSSSVSLGG